MSEDTDETDGQMVARLGTDGEAWAREWLRLNPLGLLAADEGDLDTMRAWFANAIEAGKAAGRTALATAIVEEEVRGLASGAPLHVMGRREGESDEQYAERLTGGDPERMKALRISPDEQRRGRVMRYPEGAEPSYDDMCNADLVVVGNEVVKNRYGRTGTYSEVDILHLMALYGMDAT